MTKTSAFGVSKRESHDSADFYRRALYEWFDIPYRFVEKDDGPIMPIGAGLDRVYCHDSRDLGWLPDRSIALTFTSPPYCVGKDYDPDLTLVDYLDLIYDVSKEVWRVLIPGGRYVVNVAGLGRKPYIPMQAFFWQLFMRIGFLPMGEIIWVKGKGASGNCAWGSWCNASAPRLRDIHEYLLVMAKGSFTRPDKGQSGISAEDFMRNTLSTWEVQPESAKRVGHPAPFPIELAERVIELFSYKDDVVLDPFVGSGTTCLAAKRLGRYWIGADISDEYCQLARKRIKDEI